MAAVQTNILNFRTVAAFFAALSLARVVFDAVFISLAANRLTHVLKAFAVNTVSVDREKRRSLEASM